MKTTQNTVAITGGTSGIGLAIAEALSNLGNTVIVLGRDPVRLKEAKARIPAAHVAVCDVTDEGSVRETFRRIASEFSALNLVVNAAGNSRAYQFAEDENVVQIARDEINTNLFGTVLVSRVALPLLMKQPEAGLVVMSSGIAFAPHRAEPTHSATKAALHALCRCLRFQLRETSVRVFEVCPPLTDTPLTRKVVGKKISSARVATEVIRGLERNQEEIRISLVKLLAVLCRLSPLLAERVVTGSATTPRERKSG